MNTVTANVIKNIHSQLIYNRRIHQLHKHLSALISPTTHAVLDVGCGDGLLTSMLSQTLPHMSFQGIDVLPRPRSHINVKIFDGYTLPYRDNAFDTVLFVDVLHHTTHPEQLLREASRVARRHVIVKDHLTAGSIDDHILSFMDWVGNSCHRVALPYNYKSETEWQQMVASSDLTPVELMHQLHLYPAPFTHLFDRGLHFIGKYHVIKG
jgi:ubiquinone/menaquinone biosynthesis C-methylase UbiE